MSFVTLKISEPHNVHLKDPHLIITDAVTDSAYVVATAPCRNCNLPKSWPAALVKFLKGYGVDASKRSVSGSMGVRCSYPYPETVKDICREFLKQYVVAHEPEPEKSREPDRLPAIVNRIKNRCIVKLFELIEEEQGASPNSRIEATFTGKSLKEDLSPGALFVVSEERAESLLTHFQEWEPLGLRSDISTGVFVATHDDLMRRHKLPSDPCVIILEDAAEALKEKAFALTPKSCAVVISEAPGQGLPDGGKWTLEAVIRFAVMYPTRKEWKSEHFASYAAATKNGWLRHPDICAHFGESVAELEAA